MPRPCATDCRMHGRRVAVSMHYFLTGSAGAFIHSRNGVS